MRVSTGSELSALWLWDKIVIDIKSSFICFLTINKLAQAVTADISTNRNNLHWKKDQTCWILIYVLCEEFWNVLEAVMLNGNVISIRWLQNSPYMLASIIKRSIFEIRLTGKCVIVLIKTTPQCVYVFDKLFLFAHTFYGTVYVLWMLAHIIGQGSLGTFPRWDTWNSHKKSFPCDSVTWDCMLCQAWTRLKSGF